MFLFFWIESKGWAASQSWSGNLEQFEQLAAVASDRGNVEIRGIGSVWMKKKLA